MGPGEEATAGGARSGDSDRRRSWVVLVVVMLCVALVAAGVGVFATRSKSSAGEIFLVPADAPGPDPFATAVDLPGTTSTSTTAAPTSTTSVTTPSTRGTEIRTTRSGSTPGLYGGTRLIGSCDPVTLVAFLRSHPDKATAWVEALSADRTLAWSGGGTLRVDQVAAYVRELTPVVLTTDTRVTNHGYRNGRATTFQAVLQKGTAVLVDANGVPRVKCMCGNPLTAPAPVAGRVRYTGVTWSAWNPTAVVVIIASSSTMRVIVLVNLDGAGYIARPVGTTGSRDRPSAPPTTAPTTKPASASTTTAPKTTTTRVDAGSWCVGARKWFDQLTAFALGTLAGQKPSTAPLIPPADRLIATAPNAAVKSDLVRVRAFLANPAQGGGQQKTPALTAYLTDVCHIQPASG